MRSGSFVGKLGPRMKPSRRGRKLLIASLGVAAVSYVACGGDDTTPSPPDAGVTGSGGGFVADAGPGPTGMDALVEHALPGFDVVVANLMAR